MSSVRPLHFVFKVGDRRATISFFKDILGMKVLRHEEFEEGCKAACNGPYDGKWSKTMVGYGPESSHFVCELTYNYGISNYALGNDFLGMYIESSEAIERAKSSSYPVEQTDTYSVLQAPGGYKFLIIDKPQPLEHDPVQQVALACSDLSGSLSFWNTLIGMDILEETSVSALLAFSNTKAKILLKSIGGPVDHAKAFGRIAFSCPSCDLKEIEEKMVENNQTVLTPYISLETPGKATVQVVILADPDGHEICFVGDEGFRQLSQIDEKADVLLSCALEEDKSDEWFAKKGGKKEA